MGVSMSDLRVTNWLLAGILAAMVFQLFMRPDRSAQADTFRIDGCITDKMSETPQQYLHVVTHALQK